MNRASIASMIAGSVGGVFTVAPPSGFDAPADLLGRWRSNIRLRTGLHKTAVTAELARDLSTKCGPALATVDNLGPAPYLRLIWEVDRPETFRSRRRAMVTGVNTSRYRQSGTLGS